ncbi:AraC-type DNA-binding protein [Friedmanniella luteola]|uniref:AraC-type DNA-binding protein n=1 Tax=Friedmanniella luteola TaxID=546871 RepID=A0A1H1THS0_9ACTN|nr:AraC family transcriptional regulator [Friedmanniella luteola]SDS59763.1 AraC-type DNA-binding protein [Friedmanniella luteola]
MHAAYEDQQPRRHVVVGTQPVRHRVERLALGPQIHLLHTGGSPLDILRTARQVRADAPEHVAIGLRRHGRGLVSVAGAEADLPVGHLNCVDMTRPYRLVHSTAHVHDVLILSNAAAGVSVDVVRAAAPALRRSPVYGLVRGHVAGLFAGTRLLSPEVRQLVGQATTALVRALLTTAAATGGAHEALDAALASRLALYLDAHLTDPDLTIERAAAAHHVSVRQLYATWAEAGHDVTPARWLTQRRLERAREQLTGAGSGLSIAVVARRCGFADPSHFSRRFRQAFGVTPREWRRLGSTRG